MDALFVLIFLLETAIDEKKIKKNLKNCKLAKEIQEVNQKYVRLEQNFKEDRDRFKIDTKKSFGPWMKYMKRKKKNIFIIWGL